MSFSSDPDNTNALIVDVVESFNSSWVYGEEIANYSVNTQSELGLVGNGTNDVVGDMDQDRVQEVIDLMEKAGINTKKIGPSDIFTNEYIDESIGFK